MQGIFSAVGAGAFVMRSLAMRHRSCVTVAATAESTATTGRPEKSGLVLTVWLPNMAAACREPPDVAFTVLGCTGLSDEIPVCVAYDIDGKITTEFPTTAMLEKAKPVIEKLPGWKCGHPRHRAKEMRRTAGTILNL